VFVTLFAHSSTTDVIEQEAVQQAWEIVQGDIMLANGRCSSKRLDERLCELSTDGDGVFRTTSAATSISTSIVYFDDSLCIMYEMKRSRNVLHIMRYLWFASNKTPLTVEALEHDLRQCRYGKNNNKRVFSDDDELEEIIMDVKEVIKNDYQKHVQARGYIGNNITELGDEKQDIEDMLEQHLDTDWEQADVDTLQSLFPERTSLTEADVFTRANVHSDFRALPLMVSVPVRGDVMQSSQQGKAGHYGYRINDCYATLIRKRAAHRDRLEQTDSATAKKRRQLTASAGGSSSTGADNSADIRRSTRQKLGAPVYTSPENDEHLF
jgi:hypothetical protein